MPLFTRKRQLQSFLDARREDLRRRVAGLPADEIRNKANDVLIREHNLIQLLALPVLTSQGVKPSTSKRMRDVTGDLRFHNMGDARGADGRVIKEFNVFTFRVPVTGTIALLDYDEIQDVFDPTGRDRTPVDGTFGSSEVVLTIEQHGINADELEAGYHEWVVRIANYLSYLQVPVKVFNDGLNALAESLIDERRLELAKLDDIGKRF